MQCLFSPTIRLNVFISSAQRDEGNIKWSDVRQKIKGYLDECPYIVPFIIEDVASETPSTQLFEYQVLQSDIIVILIKGELRSGTSIEFTVAKKYKKPLLVYFLKDEMPSLDVARLRKELQETDYCTYRNIDSIENIEEIIRDDIIENVIRYYQVDHFTKGKDTTELDVLGVESASAILKHGTPTKTALSLFSSSYDHIFSLLGIDANIDKQNISESPMHKLGVNALNWLVTGIPLECNSEILSLADNVKGLYRTTDWFIKRWNAIRCELSGDLEGALAAEKEALTLAKGTELPQWIINNILIDCRNIENEVSRKKRKWTIGSDIQKELQASETIVYLPVSDRYLTEVYNDLIKEELKYQTASPNAIIMGNNLCTIINHVENYFFSAMLYGSYTHMVITREILAEVFYKYNELTRKRPFLLNCIKLLVLCGNTKQFKKIIDHGWDDAYTEIVANADAIWDITDYAPESNKAHIKQAVITKLGLYLTDSRFHNAEQFLDTLAPTIYWGDSEDFFECINQNMCRLNCEQVIRMIVGIIEEQRFQLGDKIAHILLQIKLDNVNVRIQKTLCNALKKRIPFIIKNGGTPQIIAALVKQNPKIYSVLSKLPENGLSGIEKILYDVNMGNGKWIDVLTAEIENARTQFKANCGSDTYTEFLEQPYAMIKKIFREHHDLTMNEIILQNFFKLCIEVLKSQVVAKVKSDCLDCLCDILAFIPELRAQMPEELMNAIIAIETSKVRTIFSESKGAFECRVLMVKIISGVADKEELLTWCFGYAKRETSERIALAECIEQFIIQNLSNEQIDTTIISIVMQCLEDENFIVRQRACSCLVLLLETKYQNLVGRKLCEAAIDPSHYVRSYIMNLCNNGKIQDSEILNELQSILRNDANFAIRVNCK